MAHSVPLADSALPFSTVTPLPRPIAHRSPRERVATPAVAQATPTLAAGFGAVAAIASATILTLFLILTPAAPAEPAGVPTAVTVDTPALITDPTGN